jgi:DMSO reductase anchor subunit
MLAVLTYVPVLVFTTAWLSLESDNTIYVISAVTMSLLCLITVYATSMIYTSLLTIHAWCNVWVPLGYLSLALMTGLILLNAIALLFVNLISVLAYTTLISIVIALLIKLSYWRYIKQTTSSSTAETATGLGYLGKVSLLQSPHSQDNYLLKEMGYQIARKHADKLRLISILCGFVVPFILTLLCLISSSLLCVSSAILAVIFSILGVIIERWLFFAEARHTVMLYYGESSA